MKTYPVKVYMAYSFATSALYSFIFTVNLLYYILVAKLDPLQLVLVGTALEAAVFLFEVPTGLIADNFSRRLSVIIGVLLVGAAFLVNGIWPVFWVIVLAQVIWGLGFTFTSGALQAWISDEIGEENAGGAFIRGARMDQAGWILGTILSVPCAILSLRAPILIGGVMFIVLGIFLIIYMPETGFKPVAVEGRSRFQQIGSTFVTGLSMIKKRPALLGILGIGFFFGFYSEGYDRLWQANVLERFTIPEIPWVNLSRAGTDLSLVVWNAAVKIVMMLLAIIATSLAERKLDHAVMRKLVLWLFFLSTALLSGLIGFTLAGRLLPAILFVIAIGTVREVTYPIYLTWVNHRIEPQVRATVLSISSQVDAVGQIAGGPIVGVIAKQFSMLAGLMASSAMLSPVMVLLGIQLKEKNRD